MRCLFCLLLWVLLGGLVTRSRAAEAPSYGRWTSGVIRGGGYIQNVVFSPSNPNRLYCYVDVAGAFRSDDKGASWKMISGGLPATAGNLFCRTLDVHPSQPDVLLYAAGSQWAPQTGVFRSTDGGESWSKVLSAQFYGNEDFRWTGTIIARQPGAPEVAVAASAGTGIWRSSDGGINWTKSNAPESLNPTDLTFDVATPGRAWICALAYTPTGKPALQGGLWRTDDGGSTWTKVADSSPSEIVILEGKLYGLFDDGEALKVSTNGIDWADFGSGIPFSNTDAFQGKVHAISATPDRIVCATSAGEFYTRKPADSSFSRVVRDTVSKGNWWGTVPADGGWYRYGKGTASIAIDPNDANHWWFTDWYAQWQSFNAGKDWTLRLNGVETTVIHTVVQDPSSGSIVHLGMADNGYYRSVDGGVTYQWPDDANNVKSIAVSPANPSRVYATGTLSGNWLADEIFVSTNSGASFTPAAHTGLPTGNVYHTIEVDPTNALVVYTTARGAGGGVFRSVDGGTTWAAFSTGIAGAGDLFLDNIFEGGRQLAASADGSLVAINRTGTMYRMAAGGTSWTAVTSGAGNLLSVVGDRKVARRFYAAGASGVFRSTDGGANWTKVLDRPSRHVEADAVVADRVVVGTEDGVYYSTNAGASWTALDAKLPSRKDNPVCFAGDHIIAGSPGNGVFWINIGEAPPTIITQPISQNAEVGGTGTLSVVASGASSYQWYHDGNLIGSATTDTLPIVPPYSNQDGEFWVVVSNEHGSIQSEKVRLRVGPKKNIGALYNLSVRSTAGVDSKTLIAGFVVRGTRAMPILARASGPALEPFGVAGVVANPGLVLNRHDPDAQVSTNEDWSSGGNGPAMAAYFVRYGAFPFPTGSLDAAVFSVLSPGRYSVQVTTGGTEGVSLIELYDSSGQAVEGAPEFINLSARSTAGQGSKVLIAGFSIRGTVPVRVLVRATGPGLIPFGVSGVLADPQLELVRSSDGATLKTNDDWGSEEGTATKNAAAAVGAFAVGDGSKDSAILIDLPPGGYSAVCKGTGPESGVALIEVYVVPAE
ncbi:MAG: hypothetical protein SFV32_01195 [Opitutaceae bacterium]|nr:hypothetical protein [Opitutaceae bacterium]